MNSFVANLIVMFIPNKKHRRMVRRKLKHFDELVLPEKTVVNSQQSAAKQNSENAELAKQYMDVKKKWRVKCNGVSPLPGRFTEYDLVVPIGCNCPAVDLLVAHKLRRFTTPFDWTAGREPEHWWIKPDVWRDTRFREKIGCLCNGFKDYFNPLDLKEVSSCNNNKIPHHMIVNIKTGIRFAHLFDINQSLEMQMQDIVAKMEQRSKRLLGAIEQSERILILWTHRLDDMRCLLDAPVSDKDIKDAVKNLHKKWPDKQFDLVFFEYDGSKDDYEFDKIEVVAGAYRIRSNHFIMQYAYKFVVNYGFREKLYVNVISEMLDNISLTDKLGDFMKEEKA